MKFSGNITKRFMTQRGFTLIESLAAMVALLMITAALFWILLTGKTLWQASVIRSYDRQELQISYQKIENDLQNSNVDTITNNTTSTVVAFSFLSAFDSSGNFTAASDGSPVWQKYVIYYIPSGTKKLMRKEVYGSYTKALTTSQLTTYCDGSGMTVANTVAGLSLTTDTATDSATITITTQNKNQLGRADQQSLTSTVFLRN
ncbi:MAG: prepilin-type N-terminal cleavage/methylation domain-containing protein [Firmicutes bacterium]|nr:prepilin-type N-terminal cleavage/methylation domain-containing protein [Bacillota bacterium]